MIVEYKQRFDKAGQVFVDCVTACLVKEVTNITHFGKFRFDEFKKMWNLEERKHPADCTDLTHRAFESHVDCYLRCDFCKICKTNKEALFKAYDFKDFLSRAAVIQVYRVMKQCGIAVCFWIRKPKKSIITTKNPSKFLFLLENYFDCNVFIFLTFYLLGIFQLQLLDSKNVSKLSLYVLQKVLPQYSILFLIIYTFVVSFLLFVFGWLL